MKILGVRANVQSSRYLNERWDEQIAMYGFWASCLDSLYGLKCKFDYSLDFEEGADLESEVFLSKLMTEVERVDIDGRKVSDDAPFKRYESVLAKFDNGMTLKYDPQKGFQTGNLQLNYNVEDINKANDALIECVKSAFIIVQASRAAELDNINLDNISDPVQKYAVQQISYSLGYANTGTPIEMTALPINKALAAEYDADNRPLVMGQEVNGVITEMLMNIHMNVVKDTIKISPGKPLSLEQILAARAPATP